MQSRYINFFNKLEEIKFSKMSEINENKKIISTLPQVNQTPSEEMLYDTLSMTISLQQQKINVNEEIRNTIIANFNNLSPHHEAMIDSILIQGN